MAKSKSKKKTTKRASNYDEKLTVNGSFLDIVKAAGKDANNKSTKKKG
jgi:hypothetical protein